MTEVILPGTFSNTSRIGFGTSELSGEPTRKESLALLETAFDAGIRHFDTAPIYSSRVSEEILGEFLVRRRHEVTVTTKFGLTLPRPRPIPILSLAKSMIRPILRQMPGLKSRIAQSRKVLHRPPANYSVATMNKSLGASLRALRCDRINLFLLHEADATDISDDLRKVLDDSVHAGLIGAWGVGSSRDKIDRVVAHNLGAARVLQFDWSVLSDRPLVYGDSFCITYGAISDSIAPLKLLLATSEGRRNWSKEIDIDISDVRVLPALLVKAALAANSGGIVLFSSKNLTHTRDIASLLQRNDVDDQMVHRFLKFVEGNRMLITELTKSNVTGPM